jgi:NAD(P)-dependent dehydrogenase (short-subunit alcohol dehydrogenase family)
MGRICHFANYMKRFRAPGPTATGHQRSIYSATKAAVRSFARTWASDLKGRNIQVNAVSPGVIETPAWSESGLPKEQVNGFFDFAAGITPLARIGRVEEVATVVAFLASDESSFMSGSEVFIDGGMAQV